MQLRISLHQPHVEVQALVAIAAAGADDDTVSLWVKNCGTGAAFAGRAYRNARHCVVRIGPATTFPLKGHRYPGLKTAPVYDINTWQEALVVVVAHELRHQQQYRLGLRCSEVDAERWAWQRLQAYRALDGRVQSAAAD